LLRNIPDLEFSGVDGRIGVFGLIKRERHGTGDISGDGHSGPMRDGGWIKKFFVKRDESTLRLREVGTRRSGSVQRKLKDFNAGAFPQAFGRKHFSAQLHFLPSI